MREREEARSTKVVERERKSTTEGAKSKMIRAALDIQYTRNIRDYNPTNDLDSYSHISASFFFYYYEVLVDTFFDLPRTLIAVLKYRIVLFLASSIKKTNKKRCISQLSKRKQIGFKFYSPMPFPSH